MQKRSFLIAAALAMPMVLAGHAHGQTSKDYPNRPIRMIVPFAPGGASDFLARSIGPRLSQKLGQPIVIENRAGAAGNLGMEYSAAAPPDGYTVFLGNVGTLAINPAIFGPNQRVTAANFAPVTMVANTPDILIVNAALPWKTVGELVDQARKRPAEMSFASPGSGSLNRLEMELFRGVAKLDMVHVPYKGGAGPAIVDIVGGQVPMMFAPISSALQLIRGGRLRPLAVASKERLSVLPDVPTMIESGFPQVVGGSWQALMFPTGTPAPIVSQWHKTILEIMAEEDIKARLLQGGVESMTSHSPQELQEFIAQEANRWGTVVRNSNATAD